MVSLQHEIVRKLVHALAGICVILCFKIELLTIGLFGLLIVALAVIVLLNCKYELVALKRVLSINRADKNVPGLDVLAFFVGCWVVLALLETNLAYAAIMILSFGDPVAHLVGSNFGKQTTRRSYIAGGLMGTLAGTLAAMFYVKFIPALLASAAAMFVESGELRIANHHVDDNVTIPIVAGIVLWVIYYVF